MAKYTLEDLPVEFGKYKVIALDLDDTLLDSKKEISEINKKTLQKAQQQGFSVAIATGRHPKSALKYMRELGCLNENSYAVCFNGSGVVRLSEFSSFGQDIGFPMVWESTMDGRRTKEVVCFAHEHGCSVHAYSKERGLLVENLNPYTQREINHSFLTYTVVDFEKLEDSEVFYKILVVAPKDHLDNVRKEIPQDLLDFFSVVRSDESFLEFIPNHATKGTGLEGLCKSIGLSIDNAIAFGDAENDLAMIRDAGLGVAMGNGYDIVKDAADVVTLTNDENGVATLVSKFLK